MEMSQGNSLHNYLKQTKTSFFFFLPFTKLKNRRAEQVLSGELIKVGEDVGKEYRRVNVG
jgi:hypothetical protein